jgi:hypothetical protein
MRSLSAIPTFLLVAHPFAWNMFVPWYDEATLSQVLLN